MSGNRVHLASFPRSGNSFLRKILEQITGIYTGSDFHMRDALPLQHSGLLGEQVYGGNSVWVTKSHYPLLQMGHAQMEVDKVICIVRNPTDVLPSYANLFATVSHTQTLQQEWSEIKCWPKFVKALIKDWNEYHNRLRAQAQKTPTFFLTYEQMMVDPIPVMVKLF